MDVDARLRLLGQMSTILQEDNPNWWFFHPRTAYVWQPWVPWVRIGPLGFSNEKMVTPTCRALNPEIANEVEEMFARAKEHIQRAGEAGMDTEQMDAYLSVAEGFWEDCDQLAMRALEPVLRKDPENWLERLGSWVGDENKWVRRAAIIAIGRLPMKQPDYTARCVELLGPALGDPDTDVKRGLSFALRLCARGETAPVNAFVRAHRAVTDADSLWVLCDLMRSMTRILLPDFGELLPIYQDWLETAEPKARCSVAGAIRVLEGAKL